MSTLLWAAAGIGGAATPSPAADDCGGVAEKMRHGGILWTENAVVVQGTAAPNLSNPSLPLSVIKRTTQNAATLDAYRKAAGLLTGVRVSSQAIAADNPRVVTGIHAFVQNAKVCGAKYYADGGVDMVVMVPLNGAFAMEELAAAGTRVASAASAYSGLVVDAAHLGFAPALAPRLLDEAGNILFDVSRVRREVVQTRGTVRFVAAGEPVPADLVGSRPLQVRALALGGTSPSDLVLDHTAARDLAGAPAFLADGRVAVVIRPPQALDCRGAFEAVADRHVDWNQKLVLARGRGRVDFSREADDSARMRRMERAAEVDAERKLLETFLAIRVDARRKVEALPEVAEKAQGAILNAMRCDARYFKDGSAEVVMAAPLDSLAALSLDLGRPDLPPAGPESGPSGVIIDAGGLGFAPVLAPQIRSFDGRELYGPSMVSRAYCQQHGVAGYHAGIDEARRDPRVGASPLIIKAARREGQGVLLLDGPAARTLAQLANGATVFSQARVIIVTEKAGSLKRTAPVEAAMPVQSRPAAPSGTGPAVRVGKIAIP